MTKELSRLCGREGIIADRDKVESLRGRFHSRFLPVFRLHDSPEFFNSPSAFPCLYESSHHISNHVPQETVRFEEESEDAIF